MAPRFNRHKDSHRYLLYESRGKREEIEEKKGGKKRKGRREGGTGICSMYIIPFVKMAYVAQDII